MPGSVLQQKIYPYDGQFDAAKHPLLISPTDVVDANNIIYTTYSTKQKRPGLTELFDPKLFGNKRILGQFDFHRLNKQWVIVWNGTSIYALDPFNNTIDNISQGIPLPIDETVTFLAWQGLLIICFGDGLTAPKRWTGQGLIEDLDPTAPNGQFARIWLNKIWMPDPTVPGRLLHSQTGSIQFTGGDSGALDLDPNDDDPDGLTAIFPPFFGSLYVTKRFSVYKVSVFGSPGSFQFGVNKISDGLGCISHNAVAAAPGNIFFPSDEGIHYFVSTDKFSEIDSDDFSKEIQPLWVEETNYRRSKYMHGIYDRRLKSYLLLFPSFSSNYANDCWGYSLQAKKWYRWRLYNQSAICRYIDRTTKKTFTLVGGSDGRVGFIDQKNNTDYGVPINVYIQSGIIAPGGAPDQQFGFEAINPIFTPQSTGKFRILYKIDGCFIEAMEFNMTDTSKGDKLGVDFVLGKSILGGLPKVLSDKRNTVGNGMLYEFLIQHEGDLSGEDSFELLGLLLDVTKMSKVTGRTVA
jgi:hypothetical protein